MRLVLATRNAHKVRELGELLPGHTIVPLPGDVVLPPETGSTFAENALGKARAAAAATGEPAIADDSGICVAALGGEPGVRSARWAGEDATDEDNLNLLLTSVPGGGDLEYVCVIAFVDAAGDREETFEGRCSRGDDDRPAGHRGLRLRPRVRSGRRLQRTDDGRAQLRREGRDQPPRARGPGAPDMADGALTAAPPDGRNGMAPQQRVGAVLDRGGGLPACAEAHHGPRRGVSGADRRGGALGDGPRRGAADVLCAACRAAGRPIGTIPTATGRPSTWRRSARVRSCWSSAA